MKVAIIGSRTFRSFSILEKRMDFYLRDQNPEDITIISGGANGADTLARIYAKEKSYKMIEHLADWDKHGKAAGFIRNKLIVDDADVLVAFWDGRSKGTLSSIDLAKKKGIPVRIVEI